MNKRPKTKVEKRHYRLSPGLDPRDPGPHDPAAARRRLDPNWDRACSNLPNGTPAEREELASKYRRGLL